jgi:O-antigen/teichoic acid export membrane protein
VAHDFVLVVLGAKWESAIPLVEWLAFFALAFAINACIGPSILLIPGGERRAMVLSWVRLAYTGPAVAVAGTLWGVHAVAIATTLANIAFVPLLIHQLTRVLPLTVGHFLTALWPPAVAAAIMAVVVRLVDLAGAPVAVSLATDVAVGALVYFAALIALWNLTGRREGPERAVLQYLAARTVRRTRG